MLQDATDVALVLLEEWNEAEEKSYEKRDPMEKARMRQSTFNSIHGGRSTSVDYRIRAQEYCVKKTEGRRSFPNA